MSPAAIGSAVPECVDMEDDASDYSPAEQRLVDAIAAGAVCDFGGGAAITADEMASWGPERTIRATVLRQLLTAEDAQNVLGLESSTRMEEREAPRACGCGDQAWLDRRWHGRVCISG